MVLTKYRDFLLNNTGIAFMTTVLITPFIMFQNPKILDLEQITVNTKQVCEFNYFIPKPQTVSKPKVQVLEKSVIFIEADKTMYTTSVVNMRDGEGLNSSVIEKIGYGKEIYVEGYYNDSNWYKVDYNGKTGFIESASLTDVPPAKLVTSTAYWNEYGRKSASGRPLISGHTLAGKVEWLGKTVELYQCNKDGSIGSMLGTYTFDDTGYGKETGVGSSAILEGKSVGTIENGSHVDVYFETYEECMQYGSRNVYIRFVN